MKIIFVIVAALIFKEASACMDPSRGHGVDAQTTASPVKFVLSKTKVAPTGETISVRVESIDPLFEFAGHMIQARDEADKSTVVGIVLPVAGETKVVDCNVPNSQSTGSFVNIKPKTSASLFWKPNGFTGKVRFYLTIVKDFSTFWVNITSEVVEVGL